MRKQLSPRSRAFSRGNRASERRATTVRHDTHVEIAAVRLRPGIAEYAFGFFLLIAVGRINQLVPVLGALPLAKISTAAALLAWWLSRRSVAPLSGEARTLLRNAVYLVAVALLLTPFSFWRGASLLFATTHLPVLVVAVTLTCTMRVSWEFLRGTLLVLLLCGVILAAVATLGYGGGRAGDIGTMYDPNDLAYLFDAVIPIGVAFSLTATSRAWRVAYGVLAAILVLALLLTQSRGGLLGLLAATGLMIILPTTARRRAGEGDRKSFSAKVGVLLAVLVAGSVVWTQLPVSAQQRFATLLHLGSDYNLDPSDKTGRGDIWLRGLKAFSKRPVGYGPQTYPMVDMDFGGQFKVAHNSFLQMLVELGALGLLLYLRMYVLAVRALQRARRKLLSRHSLTQEDIEEATFARALQFSLAANIVAGFFLAQAYAEVLWVIFAACIALYARVFPDSKQVSDGVSAR